MSEQFWTLAMALGLAGFGFAVGYVLGMASGKKP